MRAGSALSALDSDLPASYTTAVTVLLWPPTVPASSTLVFGLVPPTGIVMTPTHGLTVSHLVFFSLILVSSNLTVTTTCEANTRIVGSVRDSRSGDPLPGASVVLEGTGLGSAADLNGEYAIRNVPPGSYTIRATYVGYRSVAFTLQVTERMTITRDFFLLAVGVAGDTVQVTAQASGQKAAINRQLSMDQIANVVSADRIQELPDANAAESVGRLPGVSVLRSGGEGTQVVIRGLQPKYNAITIDGVRMASSNPDDRSVDLSMISPFALEEIQVVKGVTPDQDADVLGGTVNFRLREARGGAGGYGYSLLLQGGYDGLSDAVNKRNNYRYVGSIDGRFFDERFGVFAQADIERRNLASNEFGASYDHLGNSTTDYVTSSLTLDDVARDRQRENGSLVLDYSHSEGKISLSNFFSSGSTESQDRQEYFDIPNDGHDYALIHSLTTRNLLSNVLRVEQQLPLFRINVSLSHAYSETKKPNDWLVYFLKSSAGLSGFINRPNLDPAGIPRAATTDPDGTSLWGLSNSSSFSRERALTASVDLETDLLGSDRISSVIKFGGKYRRQSRSFVEDQYGGFFAWPGATQVNYMVATHFPSTLPFANSTTIPISPFIDPGFNYGKFLGGEYEMNLPQSFAMLSEMVRFLKSNADDFARRGDKGYYQDVYGSTTWNYDGNEDQSAFYIMGTVKIGSELTLVPGVRYQDLKTTYTAPRGQQNVVSTIGGAYYHYDTTLSVDHHEWLPDLLVRYRPLSWFDVRLSYSNTVSYPDYAAIVPRIDVPVSEASISYNNYRLNPTRSTNYDVYLSFYDNSTGLITLGGFLKRISDLIYPWTFYVTDSGATPYYPPYLSAPGPRGTYKIITNVNDPYRIDDWGFEFDWQTHFWYLPRPLDGVVFGVNYTRILSRARYPYTQLQYVGGFRGYVVYVDTSFTDRLLYQPDNIVNLSLGYDYEGFSSRVSLVYQSDTFTGPQFWPQLRTHTSAYTRWDLSVKQILPWAGIQLYGDVNNLNGAEDISVIDAPTAVPQSQASYGPTVDVGIRWNF